MTAVHLLYTHKYALESKVCRLFPWTGEIESDCAAILASGSHGIQGSKLECKGRCSGETTISNRLRFTHARPNVLAGCRLTRGMGCERRLETKHT